MPTVGWIYEDSVERFLSGTTQVPGPSGPPAARFSCPFCPGCFESAGQLSRHLQEHSGERPVLLLRGVEPSSLDVIRRHVPPSRVQFVNCTSIRRRTEADSARGISFEEAAILLSSRHARVRLELLNEFEQSAAPIVQSYDLDIRAPTNEELGAIDARFVEVLGRPDPTIALVDQFLNMADSQLAREYSGALADYVIGVLVKDGDPRSGVGAQRREYRPKLNSALRVLQSFDRPLPNLISGFIRLSSNDVFTRHRPTGHPALDATLNLLCEICAGSSASFGTARAETSVAKHPVCPVDNGTDMVINRKMQLLNTHRFGKALQEQLTSELQLAHVDPLDRVKLCVLWAIRATELNRPDLAVAPLREIAGDAAFGAWAQQRLDQIDR